MRVFLILLRHELRMLFISPATYVAGFVFLMLMGFIFVLILNRFSQEAQEVLPAEMFFQVFWLPVFFLVPLLTMRSLAEERRRGTLTSAMTTPVSALQLVTTKFLASYLFYCLLWAFTALFFVMVDRTVQSAGTAEVLLLPGPLIGGYAFIALTGLLFIALGVLASSLTRSQLVAATLTFSALFVLMLGIPAMEAQAVNWIPWFDADTVYFKMFDHLEDFSRGVLDTRPVVFYISGAALVLGTSVLIVESRA